MILVSRIMMSDLGLLDREVATLRILKFYAETRMTRSRSELIDQMQARGVGRTSLYSSLKVLRGLDLLLDEDIRSEGKKQIYTILTVKGFKVAKIVNELEKALIDE